MLLLITFCLAGAAPAAAFVVNTTADTIDNNLDGICADINGMCSLRAALIEAGIIDDADTIILPAGVYTQTLIQPGEDGNLGGDWDIDHGNLDIVGAGAADTILQAAATPNTAGDRVLEVISPNITVNITGVTIRYGKLAGPANSGTRGGGIRSVGTLTISNSVIDSNRAAGGGGIWNERDITLNNVMVTNNTCNAGGATCFGGGMYSVTDALRTLTITGSAFSGNTALTTGTPGSAFASGFGAASLSGAGINLNISDSSFTGNQGFGSGTGPNEGGGNGSGIRFSPTGTSLFNITNTVISGNGITGGTSISGSGIAIVTTGKITGTWDKLTVAGNTGNALGSGIAVNVNGAPVTLNINNSTISGNTGAAFGGGMGIFAGSGSGGIFVITNFLNSTISGNSGGTGGGVFMDRTGSAVIITNFNFCTITGNTATAVGGGLSPGVTSLNINNSIAADNSAPVGPDIRGNVNALDFNHIENTSDTVLTTNGPNNTFGFDPQLGPLQNNGGPSLTHLLSAASPLLDTIPMGVNDCGTAVSIDQRGFGRPFGAGCDKGSTERGALAFGPWTLSGVVRTTTGMPIRNAAVTISGGNLASPITVFTGNFGTYQFTNLIGNEYTVSVSIKRYHFNKASQVFSLGQNITDADFIANAPFSRELLFFDPAPVKGRNR